VGAVAVGEVVVAQTDAGARDVGHGLLAALRSGGRPAAPGAALAAASRASLAAPVTLVARSAPTGDGGHYRLVIIHNGGDVSSVAKIVGPEGVRARGELGKRRDAVLGQHDAQLAGQALEEEEPQELAVLLVCRRQLQHAGEHLRGALAAEALRSVKLLEAMVLGEGVSGEEATTQLLVRVGRQRAPEEVGDGARDVLGKRAEHQVKFGALIGDAMEVKLAVSEGEPLLGTGGPKGGELHAAVHGMLRSGSWLLWRDDLWRLLSGSGERQVVVILHGVL
jgi:hypothetical protein